MSASAPEEIAATLAKELTPEEPRNAETVCDDVRDFWAFPEGTAVGVLRLEA